MRIAHVSDIHIRNLKFHSDYRKVFENFYKKLEELKVDLVVNTGDTAHTKTNISPEFVSMASEFFTEVAKRCPMINVLGNHDLNLMNSDREDAISPIVEALNNPRIVLLKEAGKWLPPAEWRTAFIDGKLLAFQNLAIADTEHWPSAPYNDDYVNIGLFHGSVRNCITDSLFRMTNVEYDHDIFEGLDYVMMGDIHKRQSFNDGRAWYAGSMIQQNFGEDPEKGFLLWDIKSKEDFTVEFHELTGNRRFYTVKLGDDLKIPELRIEPKSRIRISPPRNLTLVEQKTIEKLVRKKFDPHDVITLGANNSGQGVVHDAGNEYKVENLRDMTVQENLLRTYLSSRKISQDIMDRIIGLNRKYQVAVEQKEDMSRGVNWRVLKMVWNNLYNYGENNAIDFAQIKGLTGIFAPNASGKSGMIDVITVGMFDSNTKEVAKNIHLVNDNKDKAAIIMELLANKERYTITREIERVKYGTRKGDAKEWGKTTLDFIRHDKDGGIEKLVQESRPDTEKQIRRRFGTFDDFMLTALFAQWDPMDIIMCKETDRKRILFRFLDLDIFEEKAKMAKEESKEWLERLADLEEGNYEEAASNLKGFIEEKKKLISLDEDFIKDYERRDKEVQKEIEDLLLEKSAVPQLPWKLDQEKYILKTAEKNIQNNLEEQASLTETIKKLESEIDDIAPLAASHDPERRKKIISELETLTGQVAILRTNLKEHQIHVEDLKRQTAILDKVPCGDKFPGCQFLVDAFKAKKDLPDHQQEVINTEVELREIEAELESARSSKIKSDARVEHFKSWERSKQALKEAMLNMKRLKAQIDVEIANKVSAKERIAAIEKAAADVLKNQELDRQIGNARLNKREIERVIGDRRVELAKHHKELGSDQGVLERVEKALATLKEVKDTCSAFEHFAAAMGKDGIALQVLTQKLPVINEEINKILQSAAEFGVSIDYDKEDQTIRLYIQYGQYKSRLLELGSGAEKFLASVALRSALLSISNLPRSNMFIIDEGFGKLDPQNLEAVQRMFDYLKSVFDHVIVISHSDLMKDMVDNMIEITADDEGYAHVEVGG